jgi:hypothetical protein
MIGRWCGFFHFSHSGETHLIKPIAKFHERDLSNYFVLNADAVSGAVMTRDTTDLSVVGVGDTSYGRVVPGSLSVAEDREIGILFYDVTDNGPTLFEQMAAILDYSVKKNSPVAIWHAPVGAIIETDQFLSSGTGSIVAGQAAGNTAPDSFLGVLNGQFVLASAFVAPAAGSLIRAKLIGNGVNNSKQCIRVQIL